MSNKQWSLLFWIVASFLTLLLSGCTGTAAKMQEVPSDRVVTAPAEGQSMVVFTRLSGFGGTYRASVFEIKKNSILLVGIVAAKERVAYQLKPGKHLFMVMGKNIDFMSAELKENKTYYAAVTPKMGRWVAQFSLYPVPINQLYSAQFKNSLKHCDWVEKTPTSEDWLNSNVASIQKKYKEHYAKWLNKDPLKRPKLLPRDGK